MAERLSRFGVGPMISLPTFLFGALAAIATYLWPDICTLPPLRHPAIVVAAWTLLTLGIAMWLIAVVTVMRAYGQDQLVTSGVFALVRHPVYSAAIVLILPGIALLTRSWPFLLMPIVAYVLFKTLIHREDEYLSRRFGRSYLDYRSRVNEIIPIPRLRRA